METHPDPAAAEIKRLQRCINDLISVVALPAVWTGAEPAEIVRTLLDVLLGVLDLDFAYARLEGSIGEPAVEMARISQSAKLPSRPEEIGELLNNWLGPDPQNWTPLVRNYGGGDISIEPMRLGLRGDVGIVTVGARRANFPGQTERLVLSVAANQAAIGLQEARLLSEQKRIASELDRHVMRRTAELTAANEELKKEVTERARAQEVLRSIESNLRQIVDSIPGLVCTMSPAGEIELLNRQVREYFGKTLEQLKNWSIGDAVHPDDLPRVIAAHTHSITNGVPYDIEHRCRRADGVYRWFQVRALPVRDPDGQITGWYVLLTDIDDRKRLEDAVRASERNLNQIISTIPALAWSASPDGTADFLNQHYLDYLGLTLEEARGRGWSAAVHTDDLSGLATTWQAILASGKAGEAEARLRRFDGQYRWFLFRVNPASDESGSIVKWYGVNTDIEVRKRVETELRVKEERYRELFNSVPVALVEIDSQKRTQMLNDLHRQGVTDVEAYLDANPDFERRAIDASIIKEVNQQTVELFGARDASALVGASTARLLAMSPGALRRGTVSRFRGEKLFQHELTLQTLDHTIQVLMTVARPDVSRNFLALTDITKLKLAEDALRGSERRYRQLFEFMPIAMWQLDLSQIAELMEQLRSEGVIDLDDYFDRQPDTLDRLMNLLIAIDVNECAVKMFGARDRGQLLGPWGFHWKTNPKTFRRGMVSLFRGEDSFQEETQISTFDGREISVLFAMARGIVGVIDVTDRARALERLQRLQAEFARAARISMLGELAASIAHEVNQPLAAMRTNGETALRWLDRAEPNVAKARDLMLLNVEAARRATDIIARIRAMAAGRVPEHTELSLHDVIEESIVFLRGELQSNAVSVTVDLAPTQPRVIGDRIQLQQVIVNLTMNAVHAMARSSSATRILLIRTQLSGAEMLSCTFEDSGPGIDPLYLDRLFDSFFTTKDAGMGMGLPVSRSIIEAHGGVIKADNNSELGGARFSFALPVESPIAR